MQGHAPPGPPQWRISLGKSRLLGSGGHGPGILAKIEATDLAGRESSEQGLGSRSSLEPLLFQHLQINRADEILAVSGRPPDSGNGDSPY